MTDQSMVKSPFDRLRANGSARPLAFKPSRPQAFSRQKSKRQKKNRSG
jgi:hypothetical protein